MATMMDPGHQIGRIYRTGCIERLLEELAEQ